MGFQLQVVKGFLSSGCAVLVVEPGLFRTEDIAEAYGLPGTTEGLQRIQNSVQRRITEGDIEIRRLDSGWMVPVLAAST